MAYQRYHGLETRIVRIFNTYGTRMRINDGRALPALYASQALKEDITVFGDGSQTRSFTYVDDLVEGIYRLACLIMKNLSILGIPRDFILDFAKEIIALTGTKSKIVFKDLPHDDPKVRKPIFQKRRTFLIKPKFQEKKG